MLGGFLPIYNSSFEQLVKSAGGVSYYDARKDLITANGITPDRSGVKTNYTYTNLLGTDGDCEDVSKWSKYQVNTALDPTNKMFGSYGIKTTLTSSSGSQYKVLSGYTEVGKYYLATAYIKNGNATRARVQIIGIGGSNYVSDSTQFTRVGLKFLRSGEINNLEVYVEGVAGQYVYADGIMFQEISADLYNNLSVDQLMTMYPVTFETSTTSRGNDINWANFAGNSASGLVIENGKVFRRLDGTDDFGSMVNTPSIDIASAPLAVFATIRVPSVSQSGYIFSKSITGTTDTQYNLHYYHTNKSIVCFLEGVQRGNSAVNAITSDVFLNAGYIWDGTQLKYYVGYVISGSAQSAIIASLTSRQYSTIGKSMAGGFFKGDLATLTIYAGAKATEANILKAEKVISRAYI